MSRVKFPCPALFPLLLLVTASPLAAQSSDAEFSPRSIVVAGEGDVKVAPDEALIPLAIRTEALEVEDARKENDALLKEIREFASRLGIPKEQIHVDYLNVSPQQQVSEEYMGVVPRRKDDAGSKSLGYYASRNVVIRLNDLKDFEEVLAQSAKLKSVYLGPVQLRSSNAEKHREEARLKALRAAREKAVAMAGELGAKIGKPLSIGEGYYGYDDEPSGRGSGGNMAASYYAMMASGYGGEMGASASLGQLTFNMRVTVVFELE